MLLRRTTSLLVMLAFILGSAEQATLAHAAQLVDTQISYLVHVWLPSGPICVGKDYTITVRLTKFNEVLIGGETDWSQSIAQGLNAQWVEGSVKDPSIGTLTPSSILTGWLLGEAGDAPGEAYFSFHADKAGSTQLNFKISIKDYDRVGPLYSTLYSEKPIKVVNCKYKVTMTAIDVDSRSGVTIWTTGKLDTQITGDTAGLKGTGNFAFDSGFVGPPCTITYSEFNNPTTITGQVNDNGQLVLQFQYQPGTITSNVSCPDAGSGSTTHSIDLTNTGITSATFPESGGTESFTFTYAGSDMAPGTMIITVEPVLDDQGN